MHKTEIARSIFFNSHENILKYITKSHLELVEGGIES
jgi:hypothetical protein